MSCFISQGQISLEDLRLYQVEERQPLTSLIGNYLVYTSPPPSAGSNRGEK
jgi:gamma-glutamyltranspeptidase